MSRDPFSVLGVSSNATEDEIKSAYRKLAKKDHPDVNGGSADSEAKMKEINEAYSEALKIRRSGGTYRPGGQQSQQQGGSYYGQRQQSGQGPGYGGFGFGDFGFGDFGFGGYRQSSYSQSASPELRAARSYINTGHYQEANSLLQKMTDRSAEWFYLSARANIGLGNRTAAVSYARQAAQMEPDNYEYAQLVANLEGNSQNYRRAGADFGGIPLTTCSSPCAWICALNLLCNCCCGYGGYRGFFC